MNRVEAMEFAKEQQEIFGGRMGEFLKFVEDELSQTNASNTLNALDSVDLISRQAAINVPEEFIKDCNPEHFVGYQKFIEFMDNAEIGSFGNWQFANGFNMGLTAAEVAIKKLPSAQQNYKELKQEFLRMASYIDVLLECSDEQKETLNGFISRISKYMPWAERRE